MKTPKELGYMARDQYGNTFHIGKAAPRKWLLDHFGRQHAKKIYVDTLNGRAKHVGYIVANHWCSVFRVCEFKTADAA